MRGRRRRRLGSLLLAAALAAAALAAERDAIELTNFSLSPELSQWLVGPVARIAGKGEIADYLRLVDDEAARKFIDEFWRRRSAGAATWPGDQPGAVFARRAEEADRLYTEGTHLGRRTARGTVHILYGPPEDQRFEPPPRRGAEPIEVWVYPKGAERGLDGERPRRAYYFTRKGDLTVESPPPPRRDPFRTP